MMAPPAGFKAVVVELMQAPMSITGMVNVGEGAVTLGLAADEHVAEF